MSLKCFLKSDIETGTLGESTGREITQFNAQLPCQKGALQKYLSHQFQKCSSRSHLFLNCCTVSCFSQQICLYVDTFFYHSRGEKGMVDWQPTKYLAPVIQGPVRKLGARNTCHVYISEVQCHISVHSKVTQCTSGFKFVQCTVIND